MHSESLLPLESPSSLSRTTDSRMVFPARRRMLRRLNDEEGVTSVCTEWQSVATPSNTDASVPSLDAVALRISTRGRQGITLGTLDVTLRQQQPSADIRIEILASEENYELILDNPDSWRTIADTPAVILGQRALVPAQVFDDISLTRLDEHSLIIRVYHRDNDSNNNDNAVLSMESTVDAFVKRNEVAFEGTHLNVFAGTPLTRDNTVDSSSANVAPLLQAQFYYQRDNSCDNSNNNEPSRKTIQFHLEQRVFDSQRLLSLSVFDYDTLEDSIETTLEQIRQANGFNWTIPEFTTTNQACYNTGSRVECESVLVSIQIRQTISADTTSANDELPLEAVLYQNTNALAQHFQPMLPGSQYIGFSTIRARLTITLPQQQQQSTILNDVQKTFVQDSVVEYFRGTLPPERLRLYQWEITQQRLTSNGLVLQGTLWGSATLQKEDELVTRVEGLVKENPSELWQYLQFYAQTPGPIQLDNHYEWFLVDSGTSGSTASMVIDQVYGLDSGGSDGGFSMAILIPMILAVVLVVILGVIYGLRRRNFMNRMDYDRAQKRKEKHELEQWKNDHDNDDSSDENLDESFDEEKEKAPQSRKPPSPNANQAETMESDRKPERRRQMKRIPSTKSLPEDSSAFLVEEVKPLKRSSSWSTLESREFQETNATENRPLRNLFEKFMDKIDPTPTFDDEVDPQKSRSKLNKQLSRTSSGKSLSNGEEKSLKRTSSSKSLSRKNSDKSLNARGPSTRRTSPLKSPRNKTPAGDNSKRSKSADIVVPTQLLQRQKTPSRSKSSDVSLTLNEFQRKNSSSGSEGPTTTSPSRRPPRRSKSSDVSFPEAADTRTSHSNAAPARRSKSSDIVVPENLPSRTAPRRSKSSDVSLPIQVTEESSINNQYSRRPPSRTRSADGIPPGTSNRVSPPKRRRPPTRSKSSDDGIVSGTSSNRASPTKNRRPRPSQRPVSETKRRPPPPHTRSTPEPEAILLQEEGAPNEEDRPMTVSERKAALMRAQQSYRQDSPPKERRRGIMTPRHKPKVDVDETELSTSHSSHHHPGEPTAGVV